VPDVLVDILEVDEQDVVRMNRDTLCSSGAFDLDAAPVTIALPRSREALHVDTGVSQDHYAIEQGNMII
jgi:para-nitrobenzyl esterase